MMNQTQLENLSTEEYSYFLGHGVMDYTENDSLLIQSEAFVSQDIETSINEHERVMSQDLENVCGSKESDSI